MTNRGHVTPADVIDLVDGCASERARTHVEACAACRDQVATLTASLALTRADRVPEPSPLFWDHFSTRVSDAVREEPEVRPRWGIPTGERWGIPAGVRWGLRTGVRWWLIPGVAAAALAFIVTIVPLRQSGGLSVSPVVAGPPAAVGLPPAAVAVPRAVVGLPPAVVASAISEDGVAPSEVDGSWEFVAVLTAEFVETGEELAGLDPVPGSADRAVEQLSRDEQGELARLLEAELTRRPSWSGDGLR